MQIDPKPIMGNWALGWALDLHTTQSSVIGHDLSGHAQFNTERTELGKAIYSFKYRKDILQLVPISETVVEFIQSRNELSEIVAILPVPPSDIDREFQPVELIAKRIGSLLNLPAPEDYILKTKVTPQLKNMEDNRERRKELEDAFLVADKRFENKDVLLFDDLIRSGETLKSVTVALLFQGKVGKVFVVAATMTRTKR